MGTLLRNFNVVFARAENLLGVVLLALISIIPALEAFLRITMRTGIHSSTEYIQHLVIWITFAGAAITSREGRHLALTAGVDSLPQKLRTMAQTFTAAVSAGVSAYLAYGAVRYVWLAFDPIHRVGIFPIRQLMFVIPAGLTLVTVRCVCQAPKGAIPKLVAAASVGATAVAGLCLQRYSGYLVLPLSLIIVAATFLGAPIFIMLSGLAATFFFSSGGSAAVILNEAYTMLSGPLIPTIPLFTLTGFILSESKAGERLIEFLRALIAWLPGGLAIMAVATCAFFTTFTGASGVTILALGGLLSYVLTKSKYPHNFVTGLLTASGSIGLLFPPSLPVILYGVVAQVNIKHLFTAGVLPGILMVIVLATLGVSTALRSKVDHISFDIRNIGHGLKKSLGEILLPIIIIVSFFGGVTTIVETAALSVLYTIILESFIHRDIPIGNLANIFLKCLPLISGILIILAMANGLSYFFVDSEIPTKLASWCTRHIHSKYLFLFLLNIALIVVGCFMDIFSATVVVVPLILPLAKVYDIHPIHMGIIFLANLELGYLTPPVGLNLFLAAYRFEQPLLKIYRSIVPFLIALFGVLLFITYVPAISLALTP